MKTLKQNCFSIEQDTHRFLLLRPWPWPDELNIRPWPRYSEDVLHTKTELLGQGFQKLEHYRQTDRQTDTDTDTLETENITTPHLRVITETSQMLQQLLCNAQFHSDIQEAEKGLDGKYIVHEGSPMDIISD